MLSFTETILDWYEANGRDLPWRHTRDPYAIWLSEIILQQTRIAQGQAYWERFLAAFPDVESLAAAPEDEVLRLWQGLGYYSRARNLHAAAGQIVARGAFPDTLEGIRALKGVGDYTAAAIGSIAFGLDAAVLDGNVYRVLARHFGIGTPVGSPAAKKEFTALAQSLLPPGRAGDFNQGMMDFGAVQCTPASPACLLCPLSGSCKALATGQVERLPVKEKGAAVQVRRFDYVYLRFRGRTAIRRRGPGDIWQGLYEPLVFDRGLIGSAYDGGSIPRDPLGRSAPTVFDQRLGGEAEITDLKLLKKGVKHQLTHRTLLVDFYLWTPDEEPSLPEGYVWIEEAELDRYAKPRLFELLLETLD
ncbi:MAG: A/G-specific adenine glycosylase [Bacteroidales bacterium]|nr:A/G-specific adenine glycosylase [Bacteroidales bacterium]